MHEAGTPEQPFDVEALEGYDPLADAFIEDPDAVFERLREACPVFLDRPRDVWIVTRHEDVLAAFSDFESFSSALHEFPEVPEDLAERVPHEVLGDALNNVDPPKHTV